MKVETSLYDVFNKIDGYQCLGFVFKIYAPLAHG